MMNRKDIESKDRALFNYIGNDYAKKDEYPTSALARKFQVRILSELIKENFEKNEKINILDIGCGHGATASYLEHLYTKYLGIDYSEELINIARKRYGDQDRDFQCINIKDFNHFHYYNCIIGIGVLHHITELSQTLEFLRRSCISGTIFAFNEPQRGNPIIQFLRFLRKSIDTNYSENQIFFKKSELVSLFEGAGFKVKKVSYIGYFSVPFAQIILKPNWFFYSICKAGIFFDSWIQKRINNTLAWNMIIIAQKD